MPSCRICNADNASTASYCSACGAALEDGPPGSYSDGPDGTAGAEKTSPVSPSDAQILELLRTGKKIHAIKIYREKAGGGLREAKEYVESLGSRHGIATVSSGGCAGMLMLIFAVLTGVAVVSMNSL
jgi:hypothetical protein